MSLTAEEQRFLREYCPELGPLPPGIDLAAIIARETAAVVAAAAAVSWNTARIAQLTDADITLAAGSEAADAIAVDFHCARAPSAEWKATAYPATTMQPGTAFVCAESGVGTELTPTALPVLYFQTGATGLAQITVTDVVGASGETVYLVFESIPTPAIPVIARKFVAITFDGV